jgi:hypothetical protein
MPNLPVFATSALCEDPKGLPPDDRLSASPEPTLGRRSKNRYGADHDASIAAIYGPRTEAGRDVKHPHETDKWGGHRRQVHGPRTKTLGLETEGIGWPSTPLPHSEPNRASPSSSACQDPLHPGILCSNPSGINPRTFDQKGSRALQVPGVGAKVFLG